MEFGDCFKVLKSILALITINKGGSIMQKETIEVGDLVSHNVWQEFWVTKIVIWGNTTTYFGRDVLTREPRESCTVKLVKKGPKNT